RCLSDWSSDVCSSDLSGERRCRVVTKLSCRTQDLDATFLASLHHFFRDNMLKTRQFLTVATALALVTGASARLLAQGVTTGAVRSEERRVGKGGRSRW